MYIYYTNNNYSNISNYCWTADIYPRIFFYLQLLPMIQSQIWWTNWLTDNKFGRAKVIDRKTV